jgi:hypothetical protein
MFGKIKNVMKTLGLTAALTLAVGMASAPPASASSLAASNSSISTPLIREQIGKLSVYVDFASPSSSQYATVAVYNEDGVVAKAVARPNQAVGFALNEGIYKVHITAQGYESVTQEVKVVANDTTTVKVQLKSVPSPSSRRTR